MNQAEATWPVRLNSRRVRPASGAATLAAAADPQAAAKRSVKVAGVNS
jgi:hypothetical protein